MIFSFSLEVRLGDAREDRGSLGERLPQSGRA
jgi:hypothetical protein